jgi:phosphonate transport system ATP-binding protein
LQIRVAQLSARHPAAKLDGAAAIRDISIDLASGEQLAIIGPSGAGKTTLLQCIACALKPSQGTIELAGSNPWSLSKSALQALRGKLLLAPQVPPLPPRQRVVTSVLAGRLPQMSFFQSLKSLFYPTQIEKAEDALALFDMTDKLFDRVDRLSGGERQRVGLARALVADASLLLIDEPLSALDPNRAEQAMVSLTSSAKNSKSTLICTLHQVDMALKHFDRIIGLRDGELVFDAPAREVSPERLQALYANKLDELTNPLVVDLDSATALPLPAVMHCR